MPMPSNVTDSLPLSDLVPDHSPDAVHVDASEEFQCNVVLSPFTT